MTAKSSLVSWNRSECILRQIEVCANRRFLHIVNPEKGFLLEKLVRKHKPMVAVETGTLVGYSAIRIARNLPSSSRLVSIEISKPKAEEARKNIAAADLAGAVEVVVGDALNVVSSIKCEVGFVFFDVADYLECLRKLEENGCIGKGCVVVANNVRWFAEQLQPYLHYVRKSGNYSSAYHDFGFDGMEVSIRK